jgi:hypothetical protein
MLEKDAKARITADEALRHPYFWSNASVSRSCTILLCILTTQPPQLLSFLMDVSDRVEKESADSAVVVALETNTGRVIGSDWRQYISEALMLDLRRFRNYKWSSLVDLLRAARNKKHHYQELPEALKENLGTVPDGFLNYFVSRFPLLIPHVYNAVKGTPVAQEPLFSGYFA